ncbi:MAG: maleylpyruvate isomerase family mycothiol-dependent enzyme, partial [Rhodospirillaceae bacterium]|nr:maleylpyruvate isomerase family mycothiol-dependent enzyme [Rhodospirillaceae bacterium]
MVMTELAGDLRDEGDELYALLATLSEEDWQRPTPFKDWTPNYVIEHLFMGDWMNTISLNDPDRFVEISARRAAAREAGQITMGLEIVDEDVGQGAELLAAWRAQLHRLCDIFAASDAKRRMKWVGPDMSVRSAATARLMETWAHGQD